MCIRDRHYDALQVNNQSEKISFLWKEQWLDCEKNLPLRKLDLQDENYTFHLGYVDANETLNLVQDRDSEYFIQVLEGLVLNGGNQLNNENGLALLADEEVQHSFHSKLESSVLIIKRQN